MQDFTDFLPEADEAEEESVRGKVSALVRKHTQLSTTLAALKDEAGEIARQIQILENSEIPDALLEAGLTEIRTVDGLKVSTKMFVGSIPPERRGDVYTWLEDHGHGDVIKRSVTVQFGKGEEEVAAAASELLKENGLVPVEKMDVHYQTFSSLMKELAGKGLSVPLNDWGVYYGQKAVIKKD